jgi:hypothetical protein
VLRSARFAFVLLTIFTVAAAVGQEESSEETSEVFALRAESAFRALTKEDGQVVESFDSRVTGEQYTVTSKYKHRINEQLSRYSDVL